jgi:lysozyme
MSLFLWCPPAARGARSCAATLLALTTSACGPADELAAVGTAEQQVQVCADGPTVDGIDVSVYQDTVDWAAVAGAGKAFAIARINHGATMDVQFDANWKGIRDVGLVRGAYQYFDAGGDALEQAQIVVDKVGKLGPGDLPAVLDIESADGQDPASIISQMHLWLDHVEATTGKKPIIYTAKYFWQDNVGTDEFDAYPLWVANYYVECPNMPDDAWAKWVFHQHADNGTVAGISGPVDLNRFNGSLEDLQALASGGGLAAEIVDVEYPTVMAPGAIGEVRVTVKNTGNVTWTTITKLGTTEPRDRPSAFAAAEWESDHRAAAVSGEVLPGAAWSFDFEVRAPDESGDYVEHFGLVEEGVAWFADQGGPADTAISLAIEVADDAPTATGAGVGVGGSASSGVGAGGEGLPADAGGQGAALEGECACSAPGAARAPSHAWMVAAVAALGGIARRRRRS